MNYCSHRLLERRAVLRGLGACLSLPLLEAMLPESLAAPSKYRSVKASLGRHPRSIFCYVPNGVNILEWMPKNHGANYELSPTLKTLAAHRANFSVLTGLGHPHSKGGHSGADTWLTGADLSATPGKQYANSISVDQIMAAKHGTQTRFPSLQLSDGSGTGSAGHSHTLSFDRKGTPLPAENSPQRLFERLFVPDGADSKKETLKRYAQKNRFSIASLQILRLSKPSWGKLTKKNSTSTLALSDRLNAGLKEWSLGLIFPNPSLTQPTFNLVANHVMGMIVRCGSM